MRDKKMRDKASKVFVFGLIAVVASATAFISEPLAHKGATGVVKERMSAMKEMAGGMKTIGHTLKGRAAYKSGHVKNVAAVLRGHAEKMPKLFPKGSSAHPSEASEKIWANWDNFEGLAKKLANLAGELEGAAPRGASAIKPIFVRVGKTCSGCHQEFREKK